MTLEFKLLQIGVRDNLRVVLLMPGGGGGGCRKRELCGIYNWASEFNFDASEGTDVN